MRKTTGTTMDKLSEYAELVVARKACRRCQGLENPATIQDGRFDSDQIGPWSMWQGNLDAAVLVVGQDWGDADYFVENDGRDLPRNPTNRALIELLDIVGVTVKPLGSPDLAHVAFFTNAILCLKSGGLQGAVRPDWFRRCRHFLRRQIEIVRPKAVIYLGERACRAVLESFDLLAKRFRDEVGDPDGRLLTTGSRAFAVYHCGTRIQNTHRPMAVQRIDWRRIRRHL